MCRAARLQQLASASRRFPGRLAVREAFLAMTVDAEANIIALDAPNGSRKCHQQRDQQYLLKRHRGHSCYAVRLTEDGSESMKNLASQFADPPKRMAGRNPLFVRHVQKQGAAGLPVTSHLTWAVGPHGRGVGYSSELLSISTRETLGNQG